ncbi:partial Transcriptional regulatory protein LnrK, partial [Anaerolineae bacterium]
MRVLIADDHPLFRDGLSTLLQARGMEVIGEANNGWEALDKARTLYPDLILMDVNMPQMDGLEATRLIKTEMPATKIVILTVSDDDDNLFEA